MKGSCQQTRTDTAADRPPDAEKRRDTQRHPKPFRKPTAPAPPSDSRQNRARRQTEPPTRLDRKHDRHTRTTAGGQLACCRTMASRAARAARRIPARTICVGCVGGRGGSRPSRSPHGHAGCSSGGQSRPRSRLAAAAAFRRNRCWQLDLAVCQKSENGTLSIINAIEHRTNCFSQMTPLPSVGRILNELRS